MLVCDVLGCDDQQMDGVVTDAEVRVGRGGSLLCRVKVHLCRGHLIDAIGMNKFRLKYGDDA